MKQFFICIILLSNFALFGQHKIYKNFVEGMSKEEAELTFKNNTENLINIQFTQDVAWDVTTSRFFYQNTNLKVVALTPNGMGNGFNYIKTFSHLKSSRAFLESLGYKVMFENKWWDRPQNFVDKKYPYGLVLQTPDQKNEVNLYVYKVKGSYIPVMYIYPSAYREAHFKSNTHTTKEQTGF